jgi:hypothetical protein
MRTLSAAELLQVWEHGAAQRPARQALMLLEAACSDTPAAALAQMSIGQRDALLLALRAWIFGSQLVGLVKCPACSDQLELTFDTADIRAGGALPAPSTAEGAEVYALSIAGYRVCYRLPEVLDIEAIAGEEDEAAARAGLFRRCLLSADRDGAGVSAEQLPGEVVSAVSEHMAQLDPQADVQLSLTCPACEHQWPATFDIVSFFWSEIDAWAIRVLSEVHALASAYGWREADILAMTPWRRQRYLELIGVVY